MKLGLYRHYKGNLYQALGVSRHSETLEELVIYQALYGDYGLWVRPLELFMGFQEHEGQKIQRFTFVKETVTKTPSLR